MHRSSAGNCQPLRAAALRQSAPLLRAHTRAVPYLLTRSFDIPDFLLLLLLFAFRFFAFSGCRVVGFSKRSKQPRTGLTGGCRVAAR